MIDAVVGASFIGAGNDEDSCRDCSAFCCCDCDGALVDPVTMDAAALCAGRLDGARPSFPAAFSRSYTVVNRAKRTACASLVVSLQSSS